LMLFKNSETKNTGMVLMGLSVLFFSLITMKQSMEILCKEGIIHSFLEKYCDSSYAGITAGLLLTALTSSCSASVGILQALCMSAKVSFSFVSAFVIGAMLGTVIPVGAVFASCRKTTKSLFWIYCLYAVFTCIIGTVAAAVFPLIYSLSVSNVSAGAAADFQTAARSISAILFLPALCLNRREQKPLRL
ncbi:MAG: Na/Pi symporter, partial [Acutalibacteraceae bacterium]